VFVVGVGSEAGAKLPVLDEEGRERFLIGPDGQEVVSRLDDEGLAAVATAGGGEYLTTQNSPAPLSELFRYRISDLEAREVEAGLERVPIDRYQWPLGFAFLVLLWELSMIERRARSQSDATAAR
jgi:Ca-activated chloride channel family protein